MNPTALVTGGTRGIGLGIAREMAREQFDLAINGRRDESEVIQVLNELRSMGSQVIYVKGDVSKEKDRNQMVSQALVHFGQLNVLVNNAGIAPPERRDILEATEASFDMVMNTNLRGPYFLTQLVAGQMIKQKAADPSGFYCIINVSSVSAYV